MPWTIWPQFGGRVSTSSTVKCVGIVVKVASSPGETALRHSICVISARPAAPILASAVAVLPGIQHFRRWSFFQEGHVLLLSSSICADVNQGNQKPLNVGN